MQLSEFLDSYGPIMPIDLEVKQPGIEEEVIAEVERTGVVDMVTFTSFDFATAANIKVLSPRAKVGYLTQDTSDEIIIQILDAGLTQYSPKANRVTPELVNRWHAEGLYVRAWGVSNTHVMKNAVDAGVNGMTVDFPDLLLDEIGRGEQSREVMREIRTSGMISGNEARSRNKER